MRPSSLVALLNASYKFRPSNLVVRRLDPLAATVRRHFSSLRSRWQPLDTLPNASVDVFRQEAFAPSLPMKMPKGHFLDFPVIQKWFIVTRMDLSRCSLDYSYLRQFSNTLVSQEYTSFSTDAHRNPQDFSCVTAPLGVFLDWTERATANTNNRLYVAQTSLSTLPPKLRNDLPTPDIVAQAGRGDVYDASIWMGIPPTYTPLHRDPNPNLFIQLAGRKTIRLLPPGDGRNAFAKIQESIGKESSAAFRGEEMMIGEERTRLENVIWNDDLRGSQDTSGFETHVARGDGIFIPKGWWHSVKGVGNGITASVR